MPGHAVPILPVRRPGADPRVSAGRPPAYGWRSMAITLPGEDSWPAGALPWTVPAGEVAAALGTDMVDGLSQAEAAARLERVGRNELIERGRKPAWRLFLRAIHERDDRGAAHRGRDHGAPRRPHGHGRHPGDRRAQWDRRLVQEHRALPRSEGFGRARTTSLTPRGPHGSDRTLRHRSGLSLARPHPDPGSRLPCRPRTVVRAEAGSAQNRTTPAHQAWAPAGSQSRF